MRKLRYLRLKNGLTQEELGAKVHISQKSISVLEKYGNVNKTVSKFTLRRLATILDYGKDPEDLLEWVK